MEDGISVIITLTIPEPFWIRIRYRLNFILESFFFLLVLHLFNDFVCLYLVAFLALFQFFIFYFLMFFVGSICILLWIYLMNQTFIDKNEKKRKRNKMTYNEIYKILFFEKKKLISTKLIYSQKKI
jgi:hypothetical protein